MPYRLLGHLRDCGLSEMSRALALGISIARITSVAKAFLADAGVKNLQYPEHLPVYVRASGMYASFSAGSLRNRCEIVACVPRPRRRRRAFLSGAATLATRSSAA
jgi:hypothetical protein